ncbi:uncharacterized protein A4U43_C09F4990 [Asparagus officinalis]|uniref:Uncharacterized protein n=1 Tax=Asparagus officinalis TaxID=4686 RepID=A0A5P1E5E5_ASPOF|nr:uncharacterized protein A4U43_C09F4990 [Asparagus officinalis]
MSHIPRGQSPTASADGVLPSYAEVAQVVKEGGHRVLRQLITDAPFVKDTSSVQPLRKTDFLFGDSVRDPDAVFIDAEQWLHKDDGGFLYLPKIPRHRSLTELRRQAVTREMSWRLTEEHENVPVGYGDMKTGRMMRVFTLYLLDQNLRRILEDDYDGRDG